MSPCSQTFNLTIILVILFYCIRSELVDIKQCQLKVVYDSLDKEQQINSFTYLRAIKQYPHWRICFIGTVLSILFTKMTFNFSVETKVDSRIYPMIFAIQYIIMNVLIKYFQNMILAKDV